MGGGQCGTWAYMPPEVWTDGLWTPKGDVHSLGGVIFQLFTLEEKCFPGWGEAEIRHRVLHTPPELELIAARWKRRCQDLPPLLEAMLHKDFRARPTAKACMEDHFF